jgi:hypothetical protein
MTVHNISEYIKKNDIRRNSMCILSNGIKSYVVNGIGMSELEFETKYPLVDYLPLNEKGENNNKRVNFVNNIKSY